MAATAMAARLGDVPAGSGEEAAGTRAHKL
jgi:hypothetical protein